MFMLPDKAISDESFFSLGAWGGGVLAPSRRMRSCFQYMMMIMCKQPYLPYWLISHQAFSPCISTWHIPTHPFIHIINTDLSTCRPTAIDTNRRRMRSCFRYMMIILYSQPYLPQLLFFPIMHLALVFPLGLFLHIHLYTLLILICRLVDLSTYCCEQ